MFAPSIPSERVPPGAFILETTSSGCSSGVSPNLDSGRDPSGARAVPSPPALPSSGSLAASAQSQAQAVFGNQFQNTLDHRGYSLPQLLSQQQQQQRPVQGRLEGAPAAGMLGGSNLKAACKQSSSSSFNDSPTTNVSASLEPRDEPMLPSTRASDAGVPANRVLRYVQQQQQHAQMQTPSKRPEQHGFVPQQNGALQHGQVQVQHLCDEEVASQQQLGRLLPPLRLDNGSGLQSKPGAEAGSAAPDCAANTGQTTLDTPSNVREAPQRRPSSNTPGIVSFGQDAPIPAGAIAYEAPGSMQAALRQRQDPASRARAPPRGPPLQTQLQANGIQQAYPQQRPPSAGLVGMDMSGSLQLQQQQNHQQLQLQQLRLQMQQQHQELHQELQQQQQLMLLRHHHQQQHQHLQHQQHQQQLLQRQVQQKQQALAFTPPQAQQQQQQQLALALAPQQQQQQQQHLGGQPSMPNAQEQAASTLGIEASVRARLGLKPKRINYMTAGTDFGGGHGGLVGGSDIGGPSLQDVRSSADFLGLSTHNLRMRLMASQSGQAVSSSALARSATASPLSLSSAVSQLQGPGLLGLAGGSGAAALAQPLRGASAGMITGVMPQPSHQQQPQLQGMGAPAVPCTPTSDLLLNSSPAILQNPQQQNPERRPQEALLTQQQKLALCHSFLRSQQGSGPAPSMSSSLSHLSGPLGQPGGPFAAAAAAAAAASTTSSLERSCSAPQAALETQLAAARLRKLEQMGISPSQAVLASAVGRLNGAQALAGRPPSGALGAGTVAGTLTGGGSTGGGSGYPRGASNSPSDTGSPMHGRSFKRSAAERGWEEQEQLMQQQQQLMQQQQQLMQQQQQQQLIQQQQQQQQQQLRQQQQQLVQQQQQLVQQQQYPVFMGSNSQPAGAGLGPGVGPEQLVTAGTTPGGGDFEPAGVFCPPSQHAVKRRAFDTDGHGAGALSLSARQAHVLEQQQQALLACRSAPDDVLAAAMISGGAGTDAGTVSACTAAAAVCSAGSVSTGGALPSANAATNGVPTVPHGLLQPPSQQQQQAAGTGSAAGEESGRSCLVAGKMALGGFSGICGAADLGLVSSNPGGLDGPMGLDPMDVAGLGGSLDATGGFGIGNGGSMGAMTSSLGPGTGGSRISLQGGDGLGPGCAEAAMDLADLAGETDYLADNELQSFIAELCATGEGPGQQDTVQEGASTMEDGAAGAGVQGPIRMW